MISPPRRGGILVVGDVIDDTIVIPSGPISRDTDTPSIIRRAAGGSAANTAAWLAALGAEVAFVGAVNAADVDRHAALLAGVEVHLQPSPAPTGAVVVLVDGAERAMLTDRGANADLDLDAVPDALFGAHVHVTAQVAAATEGGALRRLLRRAKAAGATVSVSAGSAAYIRARGAAAFGEVIGGADVLFASAAEGEALTGAADPAQIAARAHAATVVLTLGADGVFVEGERVPAVVAAAPVDPTGAGDAFCAGFLEHWVRAHDPIAAARAGTAVAARAVEVVGGRPA